MNDDTDSSIPQMPVPNKKAPTKQSGADTNGQSSGDLAAEVIRKKIESIYSGEPQAKQELAEIKTLDKPLSKHQKFISELSKSGKSSREIQVEWHNYYLSLPDSEKHEVWQEFYAANKSGGISHRLQPQYISKAENIYDNNPKVINQQFDGKYLSEIEDEEEQKKTFAQVKKELTRKIAKKPKLKWYQNFKSLLFGITVGFLAVLIFLFGFFNDRFIAPFVTPSRTVGAQSLIIDPTGASVGPDPIIIIPKINVELPVIYTVPTIDQNQIENNLEDGVVHYPTTAYPGQLGNGAIFGHSSNNILNPGKYKFAFVLLHDLQPGDTFTLDYQGKAYVYEIFKREIVPPTDVSVLDNIANHPATFTLITCDPPGTSINRLVVVGDQISPAINNDASGANQNNAPKPTYLPSNSPSLWSRITHFF